LKYLGATVELVRNPKILAQADVMILLGVGSFRKGMENLKESGLDEAIRLAVTANNARVLGIYLGMQLLGSQSKEGGETAGLGLISPTG
jgi:glutamine amidotransferase